MKRMSSMRPVASFLGKAIIPPLLAAVLGASQLYAEPYTGNREANPAQNQQGESAREQAEQLLSDARRQLRQERFSAARERLEQARALDPQVPGLRELERDIATAEEEAAARERAEQARELVRSADRLRREARFDDALAQVDRALELDPEARNAERTRERIVSDRDRARERQLRQQVERRIEAAQNALRQNNFDRARQYEAEAREMAEGLFEREIERLATRIVDQEIEVHLNEAERQMREGNFDRARQSVAKVYQIDRNSRDANQMVARIAREERRAVEAEARERAGDQLAEASRLMDANEPEEAARIYRSILAVLPDHRQARRGLQSAEQAMEAPEPIEVAQVTEPAPEPAPEPEPERVEVAQVPEPTPTPTPTPTPSPERAEQERERAQEVQRREAERREREEQRARRTQAEQAYREGVQLYERGELARARQRWVDAKEIDPTFLRPDVYLEETEEEYNRLLARQAEKDAFEQAEARALERMDTLVSFSTFEPTRLSEFLQNLRLLSGIDFVIAGEVRANVEAAFEDEPLRNVLDRTLTPIGLRWEREPGTRTVTITPDLRTEVFPVTPEIINTVEILIEDGVIPRLLYGPGGEPILQGQEVFTDSRQNVIVMTDSESNLQKFRRFLEGIRERPAAQLVIDTYEIDERKAPEIKALLSAILAVDDPTPFHADRRLIVEGSTLVIKDTPENIERAREILQDQNFLKRFVDDEITVATFNLTPIVEFEENPDLVRSFADQVRQVVETLLYQREGRSAAERQGRRMWYDPATLQLTITDFPDRIAVVESYIDRLPQLARRRRSEIIFLDWANAGELVGQIEQFLGIAAAPMVGAPGAEQETTRTMRTEDSFQFAGANFRVIRVNENTFDDESDNSVELVVRTATTSQEVTIQNWRSEFVDDYEIVAEDIRPGTQPGQGRARLTFRYTPGIQTGMAPGMAPGVPGMPPGVDPMMPPTPPEDVGLMLVEIENLNAMFVEYEDVEDLRRVEFWVRQLDVPTYQVSIDIKFVEVITNKVQEIKPDFVFGDLTAGIDLSDSVLRSRFAQDRDQFRSAFEPFSETTRGANLLKGTTVFNYIVNNGNSPIAFELRVLEAQGVINVVNGPRVTALNNETADFIIQREFGLRQPVEGATGTQDQAQFTAVASITPVDLSVTPQVTRAGNITLDIDVELVDFDQNLGQLVTLGEEDVGPLVPVGAAPRGITTSQDFGVLRKELATQARIRDGGTVVLGGWRSERSEDLESQVPILGDIPFVGRYLFKRTSKRMDKIELLIFLTGEVVRD